MTIQWSEELKQDICDWLSVGKAILDFDRMEGYPSSASIYRQMFRDESFAADIARAREAGQDHQADLCIQMADEASEEDFNVVKLRIWARQWRAAKLAPKKYGEKKQITGDGGGAIQVEQVAQLDAGNLTIEQRGKLRDLLIEFKGQNALPIASGEND